MTLYLIGLFVVFGVLVFMFAFASSRWPSLYPPRDDRNREWKRQILAQCAERKKRKEELLREGDRRRYGDMRRGPE